jgi:hypothetical protein
MLCIVVWSTISLIFRGAPQSCKCIVNALCTFHSVIFIVRRTCLMKCCRGEALRRHQRSAWLSSILARCSPPVAIMRADGRQRNAWHYIEYIPSHLLLYLQPSPFPHLPPPQVGYYNHIPSFASPSFSLNHVFASSSWSVLPHPRNRPSFFCQCRS